MPLSPQAITHYPLVLQQVCQMLTGALRETCSRAGLENQPPLYLDALARMVAEVGKTGVAFVEEDVLATVIDLSVNKATQVRVG